MDFDDSNIVSEYSWHDPYRFTKDELHCQYDCALGWKQSQHLATFKADFSGGLATFSSYTIRYDTIEEINMDSKAEYTA